jgi:hypothetical protein
MRLTFKLRTQEFGNQNIIESTEVLNRTKRQKDKFLTFSLCVPACTAASSVLVIEFTPLGPLVLKPSDLGYN